MVSLLLPLPFLLSSLGTTFVVLATLLNLGWLYVGLTFKKATDQTKWAKMFIYSLNYLVVFCFSCCYLTDKMI